MSPELDPVPTELLEETRISRKTVGITVLLAVLLIVALTIAVFKNTLRSAGDYANTSQVSPTPDSQVSENDIQSIQIDASEADFDSISPDLNQL